MLLAPSRPEALTPLGVSILGVGEEEEVLDPAVTLSSRTRRTPSSPTLDTYASFASALMTFFRRYRASRG